jgi:cobalt-zinc-cadmium efflux system membrane fusion protein
MAGEPLRTFLRDLRQTIHPEGEGVDDAQLLERFIRQRDEAAFEVLVWRHGGLVLHVCRRLLRHAQDTEDVFQATFLALTRKAGSIGKREALASWLYKVAYRAALRVRAREAREAVRPPSRLATAQPGDGVTGPEVAAVLDGEINRLPEKYRAAVVLCYVSGKTTAEAARELGCARGTVCSRLAWARRRLRDRLTRRGLSPCPATLGAALPPAAAPAPLVRATVQAVMLFASRKAADGLLSTSAVALAEGVLRAMILTKVKTVALGLLVLAFLGLGAGLYVQQVLAEKPGGDEAPALVSGSGDGIRLPAEVVVKLGLKAAEVKPRGEAKARVLQLSGSLALDPEGVKRVRCRFTPCQVLQIGKPEGADGGRTLRVGDRVRKGQVLAVLDSPDAAQKKLELFQALVQLKLDEATLERADLATGTIPQAVVAQARQKVEAGRSAVARALVTLKSLGVPEDEIAAVHKEGREAGARPKPDTEDMHKSRLEKWAQVELRSPDDGTLIERNVSSNEVVTDGTVNLFQIAKLDRLLVLANVSEEDLPSLVELKVADRRWTIRAAGSAPIEGVFDEIGYLIDPNQHTAVVKGYLDNKDHKLRAGQFITATIVLPGPVVEMVLPASALVEDGRQSYVFVQPDVKKPVYEQRRVLVVRRGQDAVHVRARATGEQEPQGAHTLRPGERVITTGALELKALLDDLKASRGR